MRDHEAQRRADLELSREEAEYNASIERWLDEEIEHARRMAAIQSPFSHIKLTGPR